MYFRVTGSMSAAGASTCTDCSPGQYDTQRTSCQSCPAGTYSADGKLSGACKSCPEHHTSVGGASACTPCEAGKEHPSSLSSSSSSTAYLCVACGTNEVSTAGAACYTCPSGTVANADHTSCDACPAVCHYFCALVVMSFSTAFSCDGHSHLTFAGHKAD